MLSFSWSPNAPHIRTLYPLWEEEDGYSEEEICAAEARLGIRLPEPLRSFYVLWGKSHLISGDLEGLASPDDLFIQTEALVFVFENQGIYVRGVLRADLSREDPPVYLVEHDDESAVWKLTQEHLSDYLDALSYFHAFSGRGRCTASVYRPMGERERYALLARHWHKVEINSVPLYVHHDAAPRGWPIYVREGQALDWYTNLLVAAARTREDLDQISDILGVTWKKGFTG